MASFKSQQVAQNEVDRIKMKGYSAFIEKLIYQIEVFGIELRYQVLNQSRTHKISNQSITKEKYEFT